MDKLDEAAIENFVKGYCQSKGLELEKWKEIAELVKERFYHYNKDNDLVTLKEMDEKFLIKTE